MFPEVGYTQPGDPASLVHGEVVRLPWEVVSADEDHVEARVACVRRPLTLTRRLTLEGARVTVAERIENVGVATSPYTWGHHPCFSRATFAGGRIELEASAAHVPDPWFVPERAMLAYGAFDWPLAPGRGDRATGTTDASGATGAAADATVDLSQLPAAPDDRHDHACLTMGSGTVRLIAPGAGPAGRALRIEFDRKRFPYALLWQNFEASASGFPFWGGADTFAIEFATMPGRCTPDAHAAGAVSQLHPGEVAETSFTVEWEAV
jgi:galactose mutarotase-like enzyme